MKKLALVLMVCLGMAGCADSYSDGPAFPYDRPDYGCVVVADDMGEREVCNTYYYYREDGVIYWDAYFGMWVLAGPSNGYWLNGIFYHGYIAGWHSYYGHSFYRPYGYYGGVHYGGAYRGGFRGGYHGGGGFHGGHGGRR